MPLMPSTEELIPWFKKIEEAKHYTNFGPLLKQFEHEIADYLSSQSGSIIHVATCKSGTSAITLALSALNLPNNSQVLVPALTFPGTAEAVIHAGLQPVFCDVDAQSWLLTPKIAEDALCKLPKLAAILPVTTYGCPQDALAWDQFIEKHHVPVVIDAAGSLADQIIGKKVIVTFSLHTTKFLSAVEGGLIASCDETLMQTIRQQSNFGLNGTRVTSIGYNEKLDEYSAAVGLVNLEKSSEYYEKLNHRREMYQQYFSALNFVQWQQAPQPFVSTLLVIQLNRDFDNQQLMAWLAKQKIESRLWYCPILPEHPVFQQFTKLDLNNTNKLAKRLIGLPMHIELTDDEINYIVNAVNQFFT
jgi:dTDP-4-amino-4,6-dideoxygalactose transaminase